MLMWGINVSAIKILVDLINPLLLQSFRVMIAGITVLIVCTIIGVFRLPNKQEWLIIIFYLL